MGKVTILKETTRNPISLIGERAGVCQGSDISDPKKNYKRGIDCIESLHGRALEFVNVEMVISGYSARVIREWYTHIGCLPTRLQESTRYVDCNNFKYVTPHTIEGNQEANDVYQHIMQTIADGYKRLDELGIPREDVAMVLPFGMETVIVDKRNLRNIVDMAQQRKCNRAYWEFREMFNDICNALSEHSDEWKYVVDTMMKPKCMVLGYCPEKNGCGFMPKKRKTV